MRFRKRGRIAVALAGAIALPAFAAPEGWDRFSIGDAVENDAVVQPMPFEQAGGSFPGSAFYYLELERPIAQIGEGAHREGEISVLDDPAAGPIARSMRIDNSGVNWTRAEQCLTAAIYYEAASEADAGQRAVAQVVLNRVAHPAYPNTVCGVVYQGSERTTGCQFSFTCDGSLARKPSRLFWMRAEAVARSALAGYVYAPVGLATHYHTVQVHPYWAPSLNYLGTIGAHRFYSFAGAAGRLGAFRFAYLGSEPMAGPHRRDNTAAAAAATASLDPLYVQKTYDSLLGAAPTGTIQTAAPTPATLAPAPVYTDDLRQRGGDSLYRGEKLPEATGIRPEYQNSGRWIGSPTN